MARLLSEYKAQPASPSQLETLRRWLTAANNHDDGPESSANWTRYEAWHKIRELKKQGVRCQARVNSGGVKRQCKQRGLDGALYCKRHMGAISQAKIVKGWELYT